MFALGLVEPVVLVFQRFVAVLASDDDALELAALVTPGLQVVALKADASGTRASEGHVLHKSSGGPEPVWR